MKGISGILLVSALLFVFGGCTTTAGVSLQSSQNLPSQEASGKVVPPPQPVPVSVPVFYDFPDIPVPPELQIVRDESSVFQVGSIKTGVLVFRGRVDYFSVSDFFMSAMPREQWRLRGSSRYGRSVMVFEKANRICVINVYPKLWYTYAEIYVLPGQP